jgi:single-stranded DNA-binding protein
MHRNEVALVGRLSMEPVHKDLPSGLVLTRWRLAVRRPPDHPGYQRSDAIECATFEDGVRDLLDGWRLDDVVEVEGALRRRWWRGGSRYEIEVRTARRVERAPDIQAQRDDGSRDARPGTAVAAGEGEGGG